MQKYYTAKEDDNGDFTTVNGVRYSVTAIDSERVHVPANRKGDIVFYDTRAEFLSAMGLGPVGETS